MTSEARQDIGGLPGVASREDRLTHRVVDLTASDPQFRAADPNPAVIEAARAPGLGLAPGPVQTRENI
jgi:fatty acid CoA ligase FadD9